MAFLKHPKPSYLVHELPTFLHRLLVHGAGLVMGVVEVVMGLEGVLHHTDDPAAFLQVPCHLSAPRTRTRLWWRGGENRPPFLPPSLLPSVVKGPLCLKHPPVRTAPGLGRSEGPGGVFGGRKEEV